MKKTLIIFFCILVYQTACYTQLLLLIGQQTKTENRTLDVYEQYNFSLALVNHIWAIKTLDGKKDILVPKNRVYYETFNKQFLLVTENNSPVGDSGPPFFFPRGRVNIYSIKNINDSAKYTVDFDKIIINQESGFEYFRSESYLIKEINLDKLRVIVYNPKMNKSLVYKLQKE